MKIKIKISNKDATYSDQKVNKGWVDTSKESKPTRKEFILEKLKKELNLQGDEQKIFKDFQKILNKNSIKELLYLNLKENDKVISKNRYKNETLAEPKEFEDKIKILGKKNGSVVTGLSFVLKFSGKVVEELNLRHNSIILFMDLSFELFGIETFVWFDLNRIEFMDFNYKINEQDGIKDISKIAKTFELINLSSEGHILEDYSDEYYSLFDGIKRSEILTSRSTSGINLYKWEKFIDSFWDYLQTLKDKKNEAKIFSDNNLIVDEDMKENGSLYLMHNANQTIKNGSYKIISTENEDMKTTVELTMNGTFDLVDNLYGSIDDYENKIKISKKEIKEWEETLQDLLQKKNQLSNNIKSLDEKIYKLNEQMKNNKSEINKLQKELDILNNNNSEKKSNNKTKVKDFLNKKLLNMKEQNKIKKQNPSLAEEISVLQQEIKKQEELFFSNNDKINKFKKCIDGGQSICRLNEKEIKKNHEYISILKKTEQVFKKVKINIKPADGELKELTFETYEIQNLIKNNNYKGNEVWLLSDFDLGLFRKIGRYKNAINNLELGYYKNPYLALALERPQFAQTNPIKLNKENELNEKQLEAVEMILGSDSVSYLQGPPGTGKTQTIAFVTREVTSKDDNVLITSYSHEAINNAFDRQREFSNDDPNIVYYKNTKDKEKNPINGYDYKHMYQNFLISIDNFILKDESNFNPDLLEKIKNILDESEDLNFIPTFIYKRLQKKDLRIEDTTDILWVYNIWKNEDIMKEFEEEHREYPETKFSEIVENNMAKLKKRYLRFCNKEIDEIISKIVLEIPEIIIGTKSNTEILKNYLLTKEGNTTNHFSEKIKKLNSKLNKEIKYGKLTEKDVNNFAQKTLSNKLINVIGVTTTGRQNIEYLNISKNLFTDYPIHFEIIDEVSKSSTIEILNTSLLSQKILLAGDYRQLPPNLSDIDVNLMKNYYQDEFGFDPEDDGKLTSEFKEVYDEIKMLFSFSLFKNHSRMLNKIGQKGSYRFLNEQHRFNEKIMNLVNEFYENKEKLVMPSYTRKNIVVNLNYDKNYNNAVNILDTSLISKKFAEYVNANSKKVKINHRDVSFDQSQSLFNNNEPLGSLFNEYNAFVIQELVEKIIENKDISPEQIGIISVTKSQKIIIRNMLKIKFPNDFEYIKKIKIDTVDNFQGREKDIIILDLVRANCLFDGKQIKQIKKRNLDFYRKVERLNVAVSRARHKLIIVGAIEKYFCQNVQPELDLSNGETIELDVFVKWFEEIKNDEGVIWAWKI